MDQPQHRVQNQESLPEFPSFKSLEDRASVVEVHADAIRRGKESLMSCESASAENTRNALG